jgi:hypothetical protein
MWVTLAAAGQKRRGLAVLGVSYLLTATLGIASHTGAQTATGTETADPPNTTAPQYGARARVAEVHREQTQFSGDDTVTLAHTLGPAFSIAESLPGVVPVFSGVPYLLVRGATPAGSLSYYDGLELPALFHLALGPSIVEPQLLGAMHFYPGAASAHYAARTGGVLSYDGPDASALQKPVRQLELSVLDASGYLNVPLTDGAVSVAWRVGNPGLILGALGLHATLSYYDYQLRYESAIAPHTRLLLLALGDGDQLGDRTAPQDDITLSFQRLLARLTHHYEHLEFGAQLVLGADASTLGQELSGHALRASESLYAQWRLGRSRLRVGADLSSVLANLRHGARSSFSPNISTRANRITLDPQDFLDGQPYKSLPGRELGATHAELHLQVSDRLQLELGLRGDVWLAGSHGEATVSPSLAARYRATHWLELHAATALAHKPRTSPLPLPGLNDIELDAGIETALQNALGVTLQLGDDTELDITGFYHRYLNVVYLELILDCQGNTDPTAAQALLTRRDPQSSICRRTGLPTADGESHGMEFLLKRTMTKALSGFVSYTLAYATATARDGTDFTPQADVRHVINAVMSYELGAGFALGLRLHYRTGKAAVTPVYNLNTDEFIRLTGRLPDFLRLDVHASYRWRVTFGEMEALIGIQNATFSREATHRNCVPVQREGQVEVQCGVDYQPFIAFPNVALRASF